uniref:Uncharacterized protein n=1 Tax=Staphylococcus phage 184DA TaxID=3110532 RepID=A0AAU6MXL5_9CAUD
MFLRMKSLSFSPLATAPGSLSFILRNYLSIITFLL